MSLSLTGIWCLFVTKIKKILWHHNAQLYVVLVVVKVISTNKLCDFTTLFGIFLETNKHQNLMRLRAWCAQSDLLGFLNTAWTMVHDTSKVIKRISSLPALCHDECSQMLEEPQTMDLVQIGPEVLKRLSWYHSNRCRTALVESSRRWNLPQHLAFHWDSNKACKAVGQKESKQD